MRITVSLCIICIINFGCGEKKKITYYPSGKIRAEVPIKNGKWHGKMIEYFEDGNTKFVMSWKNGLSNGKSFEYYPNGRLGQECNYYAGKKIGTEKIYYPSGKIKEEKLYDSLGRVTDIQSFTELGSIDYDEMQPLVYASKDTFDIFEVGLIHGKMVNVDTTIFNRGSFIAKGFDINGVNVDTLFYSGDYKRLSFEFKAEKPGVNKIFGTFTLIHDADTASIHRRIDFEQTFFVR